MAKVNTTKEAQNTGIAGIICFLASFGALIFFGLSGLWIVALIVIGVLVFAGIILMIISNLLEKKYAGKPGHEGRGYTEEDKKKARERARGTDKDPEIVKMHQLIWKFDYFVRDNFPKLPLDDFEITDKTFITEKIKSGCLTADDLRPLVNSMIKHLGQTFNYAPIEVNKVDFYSKAKPGFINEGSHIITVNYCVEMSFLNIVAILSHEISHAFQFYEFSKYPGDIDETELFTDFLTVYLGFGKYTLKSRRVTKIRSDGGIDTTVLGYLNDGAINFAFITADGRRSMKEFAAEEMQKVDVIISKAKQIEEVFPQYSSFIHECMERFSLVKGMSQEKFNKLSEVLLEKDGLNENLVNDLVLKIKKSKDYENSSALLERLNAEIHKWYNVYIKFSEINDLI